jgi:hypothetical protein
VYLLMLYSKRFLLLLLIVSPLVMRTPLVQKSEIIIFLLSLPHRWSAEFNDHLLRPQYGSSSFPYGVFTSALRICPESTIKTLPHVHRFTGIPPGWATNGIRIQHQGINFTLPSKSKNTSQICKYYSLEILWLDANLLAGML